MPPFCGGCGGYTGRCEREIGGRSTGARGPPAKAAVVEPTVSATESSIAERRILSVVVIGSISSLIMSGGLVSSAFARLNYGGSAPGYVSAITLLISALPNRRALTAPRWVSYLAYIAYGSNATGTGLSDDVRFTPVATELRTSRIGSFLPDCDINSNGPRAVRLGPGSRRRTRLARRIVLANEPPIAIL